MKKILTMLVITYLSNQAIAQDQLFRSVVLEKKNKNNIYWTVKALSKSKNKHKLIEMLKHEKYQEEVKWHLNDIALVKILLREMKNSNKKYLFGALQHLVKQKLDRKVSELIIEELSKNFSNRPIEFQITILELFRHLDLDTQNGKNVFLHKILQTTRNDKLKFLAVDLLSRKKDVANLIPYIEEFLNHEDINFRVKMIEVIGNEKLKYFQNTLLNFLNDDDENVRIDTLRSLSLMMTNKKQLKKIITTRFFGDPDFSVKYFALNILTEEFPGEYLETDSFYNIVMSNDEFIFFVCKYILSRKKNLIVNDFSVLKLFLQKEHVMERSEILLLGKINEWDLKAVQILVAHLLQYPEEVPMSLVQIGNKYPDETRRVLKNEYSNNTNLSKDDFLCKKISIMKTLALMKEQSFPTMEFIFEDVLEELKKEHDNYIKIYAIIALCEMKQTLIIPRIIEVLRFNEQLLNDEVVKALRATSKNNVLAKQVVQLLSKSCIKFDDNSKITIVDLIQEVQFFDDNVVSFLLSCLNENHDTPLKIKATNIISELDTVYVDTLIKQLTEQFK